MKYLNQLEYKHIPYRTYMNDPTKTDEERLKSVSGSGCGLCCAAMAVQYLTPMTLTVEDCVKISETAGANHSRGTDMKILAPAIAEKYNLEYITTSELAEAIRYLREGAQIIAHVGVPEGREIGLFTKGGHYILLTSTDGAEFCILDPSYTPEKFEIPERAGKVNTKNAPYLYCDVNTVDSECKKDRIKYHVLRRRRNK